MAAHRQTGKSWFANAPHEMTECWDHLATTPLQRISRRCLPLKGDLAGIWQYEVGGKQRVWYQVVNRTVFVLSAARSHPKGTE